MNQASSNVLRKKGGGWKGRRGKSRGGKTGNRTRTGLKNLLALIEVGVQERSKEAVCSLD